MSKFLKIFSLLTFLFIFGTNVSYAQSIPYGAACDKDASPNPCIQNPDGGGEIKCLPYKFSNEFVIDRCLHDAGHQFIGAECLVPEECESGFCASSGVCSEDTGGGGVFQPIQLPSCAPDGGWLSAIGCIEYNSPQKTAGSILKFAIPFVGGIALILIAYAAFIYMTSAGNPKQVAMAKEILVSALAGAVVVSASVWLLRVIGVDVLGLFN